MQLPSIDQLPRECTQLDKQTIREHEVANLQDLGCEHCYQETHSLVTHPFYVSSYYNRVGEINWDIQGFAQLYDSLLTEDRTYSIVIDDFTSPRAEILSFLGERGIVHYRQVLVLGCPTDILTLPEISKPESAYLEVLCEEAASINLLLDSPAGQFFIKPGETMEQAVNRLQHNLASGFVLTMRDCNGNYIGMVNIAIRDQVASLFGGFVEEQHRKKGVSSYLIASSIQYLKQYSKYAYLKTENPVVYLTAYKYFGLKPLYKETYFEI